MLKFLQVWSRVSERERERCHWSRRIIGPYYRRLQNHQRRCRGHMVANLGEGVMGYLVCQLRRWRKLQNRRSTLILHGTLGPNTFHWSSEFHCVTTLRNLKEGRTKLFGVLDPFTQTWIFKNLTKQVTIAKPKATTWGNDIFFPIKNILHWY